MVLTPTSFSDMYYNSGSGNYCAYNNIKIKKFRVLLYHSVLYKSGY